MKRKLLTFLLAIFMIVPLAGCGEPSLSGEPGTGETKILVHFTEPDGTGYKTNESSLNYHYSDCATLSGSGFYKENEVANIQINFNQNACYFNGWTRAIEGTVTPISGDKQLSYSYKVAAQDIGKTLNFYAVMTLPKDKTQSLNVTTTSFEVDGISITDYSYDQLFELVDNKIIIVDGGNSYEYVLDGEKEKFTAVEGGAVSEILDDGNVVLNKKTYTVVYDSSHNIEGVAVGSSSKKTNDIDDDELENYAFIGTSSISFEKFIEDIESDQFAQGKKLSEIISDVNLAYYMGPKETGSGTELKYYKIDWKYANGVCGNVIPTISFDPMTHAFAPVSNVCISANIDLTAGITNTYILEAVKSTFYNQAYVDTVANSTCMTTNKANTTITDTCMFIRNIGAFTNEDRNEGYKLSNENTYYYALAKTADDNDRIEAVEPYFSNHVYLSYVKSADDDLALRLDGNLFTISNFMTKLNLKITPVYNKLAAVLESPRSHIGDLTFKYSPLTNNVAVASVKLDNGTVYYFNYVNSGSSVRDYEPLETGAHSIKDTKRELAKLYDLSWTIPAVEDEPKAALLNEIKDKISKDPYLLLDNNNSLSRNKIDKYIHSLVNDPEKKENPEDEEGKYEPLKGYSFDITLTKPIMEIKAKSQVLSLATLDDNKYAYDETGKVYLLETGKVYLLEIEESGFKVNSAYSDAMKAFLPYLNIMTSETLIKKLNDYVKITSNESTGIVEYSVFDGSSAYLKYKFRYYSQAPNPYFEVVNIQYDSFTNLKLTLISESDTKDFGNPGNIEQGVYTLSDKAEYAVTIGATTNIKSNNIYLVNINSKEYILDLDALVAYSTSEKKAISITKQFASELLYYFVINSQYYGIYSNGTGLDLYKLTTTPTVSKDGSALATLAAAKCVEFDKNYYLIKVTTDPTEVYKIVIDGVERELTFISYSATVSFDGVVVKENSNAIDHTGTNIYAVYQLLTAHLSDIKQLNLTVNNLDITKYIIVDNGVVYELTPSNVTGVYKITYMAKEYTVRYS